MLLTVVDYGVGNLKSIAKSIEKANSVNNLNYSVKVSSDVDDIKKSDKIVLPGQGSFKACKEGIDKIDGLQQTLNESVLNKKKTNLRNLRWYAIVCNHRVRGRKNRRT